MIHLSTPHIKERLKEKEKTNVDVFDIEHEDLWVLVDKVVKLSRSGKEGRNNLSTIDALVHSSDGSGFDEIDELVRKHLGVDTEVLVVDERL